jgi:WD40 repeat protein
MFSPDGTRLLTGSSDGTSVIWDTNFFDKPADEGQDVQVSNLKNIDISESKVVHRFEEKNISSTTECLIDGIEWSNKGRYAFCGISVKEIAKGDER